MRKGWKWLRRHEKIGRVDTLIKVSQAPRTDVVINKIRAIQNVDGVMAKKDTNTYYANTPPLHIKSAVPNLT